MKTSRKLSVSVGILVVLALLLAVWWGLPGGDGHRSDPLEKAVLGENWQEVRDLCAGESETSDAVHLRVLRGHACLALNRNDEALAQFASIADESDRLAWRDWAFRFADANAGNAMATYLKGDALARLGEWQQAEAAYTEALSQTTTRLAEAVVLNARGVTRLYRDQAEGALADFEKACEAAPGFADAHASLGTLLIITEAAEGAVRHFSEALTATGGAFPLAYNGRGCARIGYSRTRQAVSEALDDFAAAMACPRTRGLAESNIRKVLAGCVEASGGGRADSSPGMTVITQDTHFRDLNGLAGTTLEQMGASMTPQQFTRIQSEYSTHQRNIDMGKTMFTGLDHIGISFEREGLFAGGSASGPRFEQHLRDQGMTNSSTMDALTRGFQNAHGGAGGADTVDVALDKSSAVAGPWLAKNTRFSLMPAVELPEVTQPSYY